MADELVFRSLSFSLVPTPLVLSHSGLAHVISTVSSQLSRPSQLSRLVSRISRISSCPFAVVPFILVPVPRLVSISFPHSPSSLLVLLHLVSSPLLSSPPHPSWAYRPPISHLARQIATSINMRRRLRGQSLVVSCR